MGSSIFVLDWVHSGPVLSVRASVRMGSASSILDFMHAEQLGSTQCALCALCIAMYCLLRSLLHPLGKMIRGVQVCTIIQVHYILDTRCISLFYLHRGGLKYFTVLMGFHMISQCLPTVASGCTLCHVVPHPGHPTFSGRRQILFPNPSVALCFTWMSTCFPYRW